MKKFLIIISIFGAILLNLNNVSATQNYDGILNQYLDIIDEINNIYNTDYYILSIIEFKGSEIEKRFDSNYDKYIQFITSQDINVFKQTLIEELQYTIKDIYEIHLNSLIKSSYGSKIVSFFNGNNKMTLKYKYSGSIFDTSYKPNVTVSRVSSIMFFEMSSYSGKFMNSNKTYSVTAKGRVITTTGVVNNKSYIVNFNL